MSLNNGPVFMRLQKQNPETRPMTHCSEYLQIKLFGQKYIYCVTHCSFQWHCNKQIRDGEVGKMEELSAEYIAERNGTRDIVVIGVREVL